MADPAPQLHATRTAGPAPAYVVLQPDGAHLPRWGDAPALPLDLDDLTALPDLLVAGTDDAPTALVAALAARGLIASTPVPAHEDRLTTPSPGPPPVVGDADGDGAGIAVGEDAFLLPAPIVLQAGPDGYSVLDHDGRAVAVLSPGEVLACIDLTLPDPPAAALARHAERAGGRALDRVAFQALLRRLEGAGQLRRFDPDRPEDEQIHAHLPQLHAMRTQMARQQRAVAAGARALAAHDAAEAAHAERTGTTRVPVVPVNFQRIPPLALGYLVAYARAWDGGRLQEHYAFPPHWLVDDRYLTGLGRRRTVYLFSHYIWSSAQCLDLAARIKERNPLAVLVHGGPDVPKYQADNEAYFAQHPFVDVTVRGEGEVTTAELLAALAGQPEDEPADLSALADVDGLSFRLGDQVVRTGDRDRIADLDEIPSPFLEGLFSPLEGGVAHTAVIETNRGCPYGCTFCDWGSATASRIRKFSLDRVYAELEWCAANGIDTIGVADANFGMLERDVAITEKIVELKRQTGFPNFVGLNYAKNTIRHLTHIVALLVEADILTYGQLSLQSMDADTLRTIERSNIKLEKYEALADEFRKADLPLYVDLMMGLPGSTMAGYRNDLQECLEREVNAKVIPTQLLANSPMNEPGYRRQHGITARPSQLVTEAATFTREDYEAMARLRRVFLLGDRFGVLRHVVMYLRQQTGRREIDCYEQLWDEVDGAPETWPTLAFALRTVPDLMVPPASWWPFYEELGRWAEASLGVDDPALGSILRAQHAVVPARDRRFPATVALEHDVAGWHADVLAAKAAGHRHDWPSLVDPLGTRGPGTLVVDDPNEVCRRGIGHSIESDIFATWELASPISRPIGGRRRFVA